MSERNIFKAVHYLENVPTHLKKPAALAVYIKSKIDELLKFDYFFVLLFIV